MQTFQTNTLYRYRSRMGAIGAGFLINFAGREQHSVAWPDGPAQRYKTDELAELGIECWSTEPNQPPETEATEPVVDPPTPTPSDPVVSEEQVEPPRNEGDAPPEPDAPTFAFKPDDTEANNVREYLRVFPEATNQEVIAALNKLGMQVSSSQVSAAKKQLAKLAEKEATAAAESEPTGDGAAESEGAQS